MNKILALLLVLSLLLGGCVDGTVADPAHVDLASDAEVRITAKTTSTDFNYPRIDESTHAWKVIEYEHAEIHSGDSYHTFSVVDLGNGANRTLLFVTPDTTKWAHLLWEIDHELEASIDFYEDSTYSNNGTAITVYNRDRNSDNTNGMLVYHTPTQTAFGTMIEMSHQGSGKKAGGDVRSINEWVLAQDTAYLLVVKNQTANDNVVSIHINWYEHTHRGP